MDKLSVQFFIQFHDNVLLSKLTELITILAEDTIIILVGAFLYWCINPKAGQRMACIAVGGVFWTMGFKNIFQIPRPWNQGIIDKKDVIRASTATSYSFPSGHTTAGTNIYGYFAAGAKRYTVKVLLWMLVGLIGLSRIYLGCHTSSDVLAAILISVAWIYGGSAIYDKLTAKNDFAILLFAIPMLFAGSTLFYRGFDDDIVKMLAFGGAVLVGILIERKLIHYVPHGTKLQRVLQYVIGVGVVAALKFWPKAMGEAFYDQLWLKAINYALIALWVSCIYPALLNKIHKK